MIIPCLISRRLTPPPLVSLSLVAPALLCSRSLPPMLSLAVTKQQQQQQQQQRLCVVVVLVLVLVVVVMVVVVASNRRT